MDDETKKKMIAEYEAKSAEFKALHPDYCTVCQGWGEVGSGTMDRDTGLVDRDTCPACIDQSLCPHCGSRFSSQNEEACSECGWKVGDPGIVLEPEFDPEDDSDPDYLRYLEELDAEMSRNGLPPCPFSTSLDEWTG